MISVKLGNCNFKFVHIITIFTAARHHVELLHVDL